MSQTRCCRLGRSSGTTASPSQLLTFCVDRHHGQIPVAFIGGVSLPAGRYLQLSIGSAAGATAAQGGRLPAWLLQLWRLLRQEPLIAMGFRFRRSTRLGPLRFNFAKGGLSSISVGGRGASFNSPVARSGGARTTVGLPGTGLNWSVEHAPDRPALIPAGRAEGLPNSRLRPGQRRGTCCALRARTMPNAGLSAASRRRRL